MKITYKEILLLGACAGVAVAALLHGVNIKQPLILSLSLNLYLLSIRRL